MPDLRLIAKLLLDKTGFDAGLDSAVKSTEKFSKSFSNKLGQAFSAAAIIVAARKIGALMHEISMDAEKVNEEFAKIGGSLSVQDIELLKIYSRHWEELGSKIRYAAASIGTSVAGFHETGANMLDTIGGYLSLLNPFMNPEDRREKFAMLQAGKRQREGNDLVFGRGSSNEDDFEKGRAQRIEAAQQAARVHMNTQEEILRLEKETDDLNEKTRISRLTVEQRINELLKERATLVGLNGESLTEVAGRNRVAQINNQLSMLEGKRGGFTPISNDLGRIGAFSGSSPTQSISQNTKLQVDELRQIKTIIQALNRDFTL